MQTKIGVLRSFFAFSPKNRLPEILTERKKQSEKTSFSRFRKHGYSRKLLYNASFFSYSIDKTRARLYNK